MKKWKYYRTENYVGIGDIGFIVIGEICNVGSVISILLLWLEFMFKFSGLCTITVGKIVKVWNNENTGLIAIACWIAMEIYKCDVGDISIILLWCSCSIRMFVEPYPTIPNNL